MLASLLLVQCREFIIFLEKVNIRKHREAQGLARPSEPWEEVNSTVPTALLSLRFYLGNVRRRLM